MVDEELDRVDEPVDAFDPRRRPSRRSRAHSLDDLFEVPFGLLRPHLLRIAGERPGQDADGTIGSALAHD